MSERVSGEHLRPGLWCKCLIAKGGARSPQIWPSGVCRWCATPVPPVLNSRLLQCVKVAGVASLRMPLQDYEVAL